MAAKKRVLRKKKTVPRKKTTRVRKQKPVVFNEVKKILFGVAILLSVCLTAAMLADIFLQPGRSGKINDQKSSDFSTIKPIQEDIVPEIKKKTPVKGLKEKTSRIVIEKSIAAVPGDSALAQPKEIPEKAIEYEVFKDVDHRAVEKPILPKKDKVPQIAIIIDDIGYDRKVAMALCDLHPNITFSVLPFAPFGRSLSERLHKKGSQLMLHLPMEPLEYPEINPGPGAILSSMPPDVLLAQLKKNIRNIPHIRGVNNHMGSRLTTHANQVNQIFTILKKENLFFIDSRTAPKSQCKASARLLKLKFAQRDVFLDNLQDNEYIAGQFRELIRVAKKHGAAIGIGHPYKATLETLSQELPKIKNRIKIVRASELTVVPG